MIGNDDGMSYKQFHELIKKMAGSVSLTVTGAVYVRLQLQLVLRYDSGASTVVRFWRAAGGTSSIPRTHQRDGGLGTSGSGRLCGTASVTVAVNVTV